MMFGKRYNNCVKKEGFSDWRDELGFEGKDSTQKRLKRQEPCLAEGQSLKVKVNLDWLKSKRCCTQYRACRILVLKLKNCGYDKSIEIKEGF